MVVKNVDFAQLDASPKLKKRFSESLQKSTGKLLDVDPDDVLVSLAAGSVRARCDVLFKGEHAVSKARKHAAAEEDEVAATVVSDLRESLGRDLDSIATGDVNVEGVETGIEESVPQVSASGGIAILPILLVVVGGGLIAAAVVVGLRSRSKTSSPDYSDRDLVFQPARDQSAPNTSSTSRGGGGPRGPRTTREEEPEEDAWAMRQAMLQSVEGQGFDDAHHNNDLQFPEEEEDSYGLLPEAPPPPTGSSGTIGSPAPPTGSSGTAGTGHTEPQVDLAFILNDLEMAEEVVFKSVFDRISGGQPVISADDPNLAQFLDQNLDIDIPAAALFEGHADFHSFLHVLREHVIDDSKATSLFFDLCATHGEEVPIHVAGEAARAATQAMNYRVPSPGTWDTLMLLCFRESDVVVFDDWQSGYYRLARMVRLTSLLNIR